MPGDIDPTGQATISFDGLQGEIVVWYTLSFSHVVGLNRQLAAAALRDQEMCNFVGAIRFPDT